MTRDDPTTAPMIVVQIPMPWAMKQRLRLLAVERGVSMSEIVRTALVAQEPTLGGKK